MDLKGRITDYRNTHVESRLILGVLLGEFDRVSKNPSDEECTRIIKKLIESNVLCGEFKENEILERFVPQQLCEDTIWDLIDENDFATIGECMKYFKINHAGLYDGRVVKTMFEKYEVTI